MSDLLNIGASGVRAYRNAMTTVAENTANVDSPGYVRRDARLAEQGSARTGNPNGVTTAAIARVWDDFKAADARLSASDAGRSATRSAWLSSAETALPDGDDGIGATMSSFFQAGTKLSADPNGTLPRRQLVTSLGDTANRISTSAKALARVSTGISDEATTTATAINDDLTSLADVNLSLTRATPGTNAAASLADERDRLLDGLSAKIGIDTRFDAKGAATVSLSGNAGVTLLRNGEVNRIGIATATDGRLAVSVRSDGDTVVVPTGGSLAGLVDAAAQVAGSRTTLDAIAVDFQGKVNAWNAGGTTPAGTAGGALLAGADAASLTLAAGVDGAAIAAKGSDGSANGNILKLTDIRTAGTGPEARVETLIGLNAQLLASTRAEASATATRSDNAFAARDATSAVDLDREASDLLRYQQAYNGSARVLQVAKETLNTIFQLF